MNKIARYIICIIVSLLATKTMAQCDTIISCIDINTDTITFNGADWSPLFDCLHTLQSDAGLSAQREVVSIVHLGDSHVQAGHFSTTLRICMQRLWGNAGRGLITPLKLSKTNEPTDYCITSPDKWSYKRCIIGKHFDSEVGVGGIFIQPLSKYMDLTFQATSIQGENATFCSLRLFHTPDDRFPQLLPKQSLDSMQIDFKEGETLYQWASTASTDILQLQGANSYDNTCGKIYGAVLENNQSGVLLHSIGNNSATYECYNNVTHYGAKLATLKPHLLIVSMGTNESVSSTITKEKLYQQIDLLITSIKKDNPQTIILLTTPADNKLRKIKRRNKRRISYYVQNPHIETVVETIKQYGIDNQIAVWDWYTISGGKNSCETWIKEKGMAKDHIHYTQNGYTIQGKLLYESIHNAYEQYIR